MTVDLPYAADPIAERMVLGCVLATPAQSERAFLALGSDVWTDGRCLTVATVIGQRYQRGIPIEPIGVMKECVDRSGTDHGAKQVGQFVYELGGIDMPSSGLAYYAERIVALATVRRIYAATLRCGQRVTSPVALDDEDVFRTAVSDMREACEDALVSFRTQPVEPPMSATELLTGSDEYDWLVPGLLEYTDRLIITGLEGLGKALSVDTPVPTPSGWSSMGSLAVGDEVFAPDGSVTQVVAATDILRNRPCYRITFSDGAQVVADENHLWLTETLKARTSEAKVARRGPLKPRGSDQSHLRKHFPCVVTTAHIADTLYVRSDHAVNHSIACSQPLDPPAKQLPISPYLLGIWLSDGTTSTGTLTLNRQDAGAIEAQIGMPHHRVPSAERPGSVLVRVDGLSALLRKCGLAGYKHIPTDYMRASAAQRWELLAGLLDGDGHIVVGAGYGCGTGAALCELTFCDKQLAGDALELLWSLGLKATSHESDAKLNGRVVGRRWRMTFQANRNPFRTPRKADRWIPLRTRRAELRYITAVELISSAPVRCIQVARPDGMFVVGRECIPTHNSFLTAQIAAAVAAGIHPLSTEPLPKRSGGYRVLVVDCENSRRQLRRRFRKLLRQVDAACVANGVEPPDWSAVLRFVIRPEGISLTEPRELARMEQAVAATAPDLLVIGPMYRLSRVDVRDEQAAKELTDTIDLLRVRHNLTVVIETHAGHGTNSQGTRQLRPLGSSLFLRWPEFGYGLRPHISVAHEDHPSLVEVGAWRGGRDERHWPKTLKHGTTLPWEPADPEYWSQAPLRGVS